MKTNAKNAGIVLAVAALSLVVAAPAMAQAAAGGAGGAFTNVYNWFMTNVWAGLTLMGVVCVGLMFWLGRAAIFVIAMAAIGGLIVKFAPDISAFFA